MTMTPEARTEAFLDRCDADDALADAFFADPAAVFAREVGELTDEQLAAVTGGTSFDSFVIYHPHAKVQPKFDIFQALIDKIKERRKKRRGG